MYRKFDDRILKYIGKYGYRIKTKRKKTKDILLKFIMDCKFKH